jgi:hypothetical protein
VDAAEGSAMIPATSHLNCKPVNRIGYVIYDLLHYLKNSIYVFSCPELLFAAR